jgi:hypothetical protein
MCVCVCVCVYVYVCVCVCVVTCICMSLCVYMCALWNVSISCTFISTYTVLIFMLYILPRIHFFIHVHIHMFLSTPLHLHFIHISLPLPLPLPLLLLGNYILTCAILYVNPLTQFGGTKGLQIGSFSPISHRFVHLMLCHVMSCYVM